MNTNIEQEFREVKNAHLTGDRFPQIFPPDRQAAIRKILSQPRSTGPIGYTTSLVIARILKVKERISSDRELSEKLAKIQIYREAVGIKRNRIPAPNTFNTLRSRLGVEGFVQIHQQFVLQANKICLLTPPIPDLPNVVRDKIILIGDSTFLKAVARTKGKKDENDNWIFTDDSIAFCKPHRKHKYPVGRRAHTPIAVTGIPVVSLIAPADESDQVHILPHPGLPFVCVILDAGYDAEDLHRDIYTDFKILPIIIPKPSMKWGPKLGETGTPSCLFGYPTRRKGIEYKQGRTKFACYRTCLEDPQELIFTCDHFRSKSRFGWMTYTYFKDDFRRQGPAVPGSRLYERLKTLRTGIERCYRLTNENRYHMENNNTYTDHDNVLIHTIEHDIVATPDILYEHSKTGKWSDVLNI